uniref:Stromal cell-derived factor 1 n=1 Tax=Cebus imitator TaxID=2715852 RepID=A0A2K5PTB3_CEBIM
MNAKVLVVLALVLTALCLSDGKPVSLSYRCPCRFFESHVARANVKHLKILNTPNCALQIVARLKNNNRQVCIDPKLKWIQEYLEKEGVAGARALHSSLPRIRFWPPPAWSWPSPGDM